MKPTTWAHRNFVPSSLKTNGLALKQPSTKHTTMIMLGAIPQAAHKVSVIYKSSWPA